MGRGSSGRIAAAIRPPIRDPRLWVPPEERGTYKEFTDRPSRTSEFEYQGDGRETVRWFDDNSNYDELIRSMNNDDHGAFRSWMNGYWMSGRMYQGYDNLSSGEQAMVRSYDKILDQSVVREAFTVRRLATAELVLGAGNRNVTSLEQLQAMRGQIVTSKGNMSTAAASRGLGIGSASRKSVEYVMKFPAGSKGAGMWIGDRRIGGWGAKQREFMTNRDINFRVGNTTYNSRTGKYEVELIFDGRNEHDYGRRGR